MFGIGADMFGIGAAGSGAVATAFTDTFAVVWHLGQITGWKRGWPSGSMWFGSITVSATPHLGQFTLYIVFSGTPAGHAVGAPAVGGSTLPAPRPAAAACDAAAAAACARAKWAACDCACAAAAAGRRVGRRRRRPLLLHRRLPPHAAAAAAAAVGLLPQLEVVAEPLLRVAQRAVRLAHVLERVLGARRLVLVGVQRHGQLAVRALDLLHVGAVGDAEHLVVVGRAQHPRHELLVVPAVDLRRRRARRRRRAAVGRLAV